MGRLVHTVLGSSSLVAHVLQYPPPSHNNSFVLGPAVTNTHTHQLRNQSKSFRFNCDAFYQGLKGKVGLAAAKAAAFRINLNVQDSSIISPPMHAPSRTTLLLPLLLSYNIPLSPPKQIRMVRTFLKVHTRPRLAYVLGCRGY